jgi:hypothetical protein
MSHKIFMNFVKILKCLLRNSYQLQNILKNFEFYIVYVNHNEQHNGK